MSNKKIIDIFLNPKSVAVIGASKSPLKGGHRIINNLLVNNYKGAIYPINPNQKGQVFNLDFKNSVLDIEDEVDLAIFYSPNKVIPEILEECIQKGIKGAIIETAGFEEVGGNGLELSEKIYRITDNFSKIRIVGPNCMGITRIDGDSKDKENKGGFFSSFGLFSHYKRGNIAIISQSGMLNGGYLTHVAEKYPDIGFRYSCSIGNKMDLSENEFLEYFIDDPTVNVIAIYLESFKDPRKFIELCKKAKNVPNKTIILVKGGSTSQGQKASLSHTAALTENSKLIDAIIKQAKIIRANTFHELFQFARTFSMMYITKKNLPKNGKVSMIAGSGGAGTITADLIEKYRLEFPIFSEEGYKTLEGLFPEWMPPNKFALVDFWPAMEKAMMRQMNLKEVMSSVYDVILGSPEIEGLFIMLFCSRMSRVLNNIDDIISALNTFDKPFFFWLVGEHKEVQRVSKILERNNIPDFVSLEEMVKNFWVLVQESKNRISSH